MCRHFPILIRVILYPLHYDLPVYASASSFFASYL